MGSYNARLIYPIGYSRRRAAVGQPQRSSGSHRITLTTSNQKYGKEFYGKGSDFQMQEETGVPGENLPRRVWNRQTKFTYNHWLAALVKGKCTSTKPTRLATGVVCHPDTERNRPYKIPWSCRGLNRGPTSPQARTLPVCHTTPITTTLYL